MNIKDKLTGYYNLITDLAKKIGILKGYDTAYTVPSTGMMIINHDGINYLVTVDALSNDVSLSEEMKRSEHYFRDREDMLISKVRFNQAVENIKE